MQAVGDHAVAAALGEQAGAQLGTRRLEAETGQHAAEDGLDLCEGNADQLGNPGTLTCSWWTA
jgi:hypothetical protein